MRSQDFHIAELEDVLIRVVPMTGHIFCFRQAPATHHGVYSWTALLAAGSTLFTKFSSHAVDKMLL